MQIRLPPSAPIQGRIIVGANRRMRCEKSGDPSAACASALIRERRRSSANGSVRVHSARVVEVTVNKTIKEMANVEPADPAGGVRVADDVDCAAVGPADDRTPADRRVR